MEEIEKQPDPAPESGEVGELKAIPELFELGEVFEKEDQTIEDMVTSLPEPLKTVFKIQEKAMKEHAVFHSTRPELEQKAMVFDWRLCENMQDVLNNLFAEGWFLNLHGESAWQSEPSNKILFVLSREKKPEGEKQ